MNGRGVRVLLVACIATAALVVAFPTGAGAQGATPRTRSRPTDAFCTKTGPPPTGAPIKVVQIRSQLEKYEPLGYSLPVGNVNDMFQVFTDQINACGGIRGRKVVLQNEEYDPTNPASRDAACIAATEDDKAFVVVNANTLTGTGPYCVAGDHETPLVYVGGATDAQYRVDEGSPGVVRSVGRRSGASPRRRPACRAAVKGKKVAVASTDLPDQVDVVQQSLVGPLKKAGVEVVAYDVIAVPGQHRVHPADPAVGHEDRRVEARRGHPGADPDDPAGLRERDGEGGPQDTASTRPPTTRSAPISCRARCCKSVDPISPSTTTARRS